VEESDGQASSEQLQADSTVCYLDDSVGSTASQILGGYFIVNCNIVAIEKQLMNSSGNVSKGMYLILYCSILLH
jgi:hypothetical protein